MQVPLSVLESLLGKESTQPEHIKSKLGQETEGATYPASYPLSFWLIPRISSKTFLISLTFLGSGIRG